MGCACLRAWRTSPLTWSALLESDLGLVVQRCRERVSSRPNPPDSGAICKHREHCSEGEISETVLRDQSLSGWGSG